VLVLASPPRVAVFVWASWSLSKKNWWRYWITIDNVLLLTIVISIIYSYMLLKVPAAIEHLAGDLGWRIAAVVSLPTIMSAFNGNFRILVKMYPWTPATIFIYKVLRIYAVVTGTITQLNLRTTNVDGMDPGLLILYVSSQVSYHVSLLSRIPSWTAWQRSMEAKAKAAKEAGVNLTLDSASQSPKFFSALANNDALGYTSFDEENEESIQFFQNSGNDPAVSLQLGTNDDAAIPVDLSNMKSLQQDTHAILSGDEESDADGYL
jgi:ABC-type xylose transport system permease subunit